jgi:long-subunit fatty acid transport protein
MERLRAIGSAVLVVMATMGAPTLASAQTNDDVFPELNWNFATPGARANAMGRAFIGVADDATAPVTNPAGLTQLTRRQFYIEVKRTDLRVPRLAAVDSFHTGRVTEFGGTINSVPFLSISAPVGRRLTVAFTRHELVRFEEDFALDPRPVPDTTFVSPAAEASSRFVGVTYAGSLAIAITSRLQLGVSVTLNRFSADAIANRFETTRVGPGLFDVARTNTIVRRTRFDDTDSKPGVIAGALYRPSDKVALGLVFASGPRFEVDVVFEENTSGPANNSFVAVPQFSGPVVVHVPYRFGGGLALNPSERLLIALDVAYVHYSSLAREVRVFSPFLTGDEYSIDNVFDIHLGGEYRLLTGRRSLFIRGGGFTNQNHRVRFNGTLNQFTQALEFAKFNRQLRVNQHAGTVGFGVTFGSRVQLDVAYISTGDFVASTAVRF